MKRIIWGECGHAWRAGMHTDTLKGPLDWLNPSYPVHIAEWTQEMIKKGAFHIDKSVNDQFLVTYHDPRNPAPAAMASSCSPVARPPSVGSCIAWTGAESAASRASGTTLSPGRKM